MMKTTIPLFPTLLISLFLGGALHAIASTNAPFGQPAQQVYGPDIHTDQGLWQVKGTTGYHDENYQIPQALQDKQLYFFDRWTDPSIPIEAEDTQWLLDYSYHKWRKESREMFSYSASKNTYSSPNYPHVATQIADHFEKHDPRKEYIDWLIVYSEVKASLSPNHDPNTAKYHNVMMQGYLEHLLLRTAELIYRHPELYNEVVPDYGLPFTGPSGSTYKEKADFFFEHGLNGIDHHSLHSGTWGVQKGAYLGGDTSLPEDDRSYLPWNRAFSLLRAKADAIVLMEAIDPVGYKVRIDRYRQQMNSNFEVWFGNQLQVPTSRGNSRSWSYGFASTNSMTPEAFGGEDIGHGTATLHLTMQIAEYIDLAALTPERLRDIAVNFIENIYLPDEVQFRMGEHIYRKCQTPSSSGTPAFRSLFITPYHLDGYPTLCKAARAHHWRSPYIHYWMLLYKAKKDYHALLAAEEARIASLTVTNNPPAFTQNEYSFSVTTNMQPGDVFGAVTANDPDAGQSVSYWITAGNRTKVVEVDPNTGDLLITSTISDFDIETVRGLELTVTAVDNGDPQKRVDTTVHITSPKGTPDIDSDLILHCTFDSDAITGSGQITDLSSFQHHGTIHTQYNIGPAACPGYNSPQGLKVGRNGYVQFPDELVAELKSPGYVVSIAFWAKDLHSLSTQLIQGRNDHSKPWDVISIKPNGNHIRFSAGSPWYASVNDIIDVHKSKIPSTGWNHICMVKNGSTQSITVYVNGIPVNRRAQLAWPIQILHTLCIGSESDSRSGDNPNVSIDDFRIYKRRLSKDDIDAIIQIPPPPPPTPRVWYTFDDSSHIGEDSSGNGFDGTVSGPTFTTTGKYGGALEFPGTGEVTVPTSVFDTVTNELTVAFWLFDPDASAGGQTFVYGPLSGFTGYHYFQIGNWSQTLAYTINGDKVDTSVSDASFVGAWHHFAFTKNTATGEMITYMDGVEINRSSSASMALLRPDSLLLGRRANNTENFTGIMDDFRIYDKVLTDWEISNVMNGLSLNSYLLNQDTDRDGVNDFLEHAFAMNANLPDAHLLTTFTFDGAGNTEYEVRNLKDTYTYVLQTSEDLQTWDDYQTLSGQTGGSLTKVVVPLDHYGVQKPLFIRVKVSD